MEDPQKTGSPAMTPQKEYLGGNLNLNVFGSFFKTEPNPGERAEIIKNRTGTMYSLSNGVIESYRQIIRNESGQTNHKPYLGKYQPKPLKDSSSAVPVKESQIPWFSTLIFTIVIILAIAELSLFIF